MASASSHTRWHAVSFSPRCRLTQRQLLIYRAVRATRMNGKLFNSFNTHTNTEHTYKQGFWPTISTGQHLYTKQPETEKQDRRIHEATHSFPGKATGSHEWPDGGLGVLSHGRSWSLRHLRLEKGQGKCRYHSFANARDLCTHTRTRVGLLVSHSKMKVALTAHLPIHSSLTSLWILRK